MNAFNSSQSRSVSIGFQDVHSRLCEIEAVLVQAEIASPFSHYVHDLNPTEVRIVRDYFAQIRTTMLSLLKECEIPLEVQRTSLRWALQTHLALTSVAVAELGPRNLEGYGTLSIAGHELATRIRQELDRLVNRVTTFLVRKSAPELTSRLARLGNAGGSDDLRLIDRVITRWGLVEFRPQLDVMARRMESPEFEIAVFGRVSSGKSSLLNHIVGVDFLPVGVTPVTAVPTRLVRGGEPKCEVTTAESGIQTVRVDALKDYASEQGNPGNCKHVTDILLHVTSPRLPDGVVLVDTPGVGSLARSGSIETMAYLPQCDLGVVMVDSASTLNEDDLGLLHSLQTAGTPIQILLSKADVLTPADRQRSIEYVRSQVKRNLDLDVPIHLVSTVGTDEALLSQWFDNEIGPLLQQHRKLVEESIRRKVIVLRSSIAATLRTMGGSSFSSPVSHETLIKSKSLLSAADDAMATFQNLAREWGDDSISSVKQIILKASQTNSPSDIIPVARQVLLQRGQTAVQIARSLQETLDRTLTNFAETGLIPVDSGVVSRVPIRGLPEANLDLLSRSQNKDLPWWWKVPGLTQKALLSTFGDRLDESVKQYNRVLRLWLQTIGRTLIESFESQAEIIREQTRRLSDDRDRNAADADQGAIAADIREILGDYYDVAISAQKIVQTI